MAIKKFKTPRKYSQIKYLIITLLAMVLAGFLALKFFLWSLPPIQNLNSFKPNIVTKIYSADDEVIKTFTAYKFEKVEIADVPEFIKEAFIATEDKNFYSHSGFDPLGLVRSSIANLKAGRVVQGASTITQQLARILFLSNAKTFDRKLKEFIIAARIEKTISKDQILEMYLNNVYLGSGAYGISGAAQIYFNKPLKDLTIAQSALIAGMPQAPSVYSPFNSLEKAKKRRAQVLECMYRNHFIKKQEYKEALAEEIVLNPNPQIYSLNRAPYFVDTVMKELDALGFDETEISQGGYKIVTTLNYKAQKAADDAIAKNLRAWGLTKDNQQASAFAFSPIDGKILVYIGGKDYSKSQYDRISQAVRPPGSSFKPFVYAAAVEKGWGPNDLLDDLPVTINDWSPRNYGNKYRGEMPLYAGLMLSSNAMVVRLIKEVGIRQVIQTARSLGLSTPIEYDYTIALGSNGVKLNEMTIAYGAFANGGYKVKPYAVERVETSRGQIVYQAPKTKVMRVIDMNTAANLTAMLKTVITNGTGMSANISKPCAAKTGTTDDYKDAWFIGYTPDVVMGVWVGNDDNTKMNVELTGGTVPAAIWKDAMIAATQEFGASEFNYPEIEIKKIKLGEKMGIESANELLRKKEQSDEDKTDETQMDLEAPVLQYKSEFKPVKQLPSEPIKPISSDSSFSQTFSEIKKIPSSQPAQPIIPLPTNNSAR